MQSHVVTINFMHSQMHLVIDFSGGGWKYRKLKTSKQFIYERFVASICIPYSGLTRGHFSDYSHVCIIYTYLRVWQWNSSEKSAATWVSSLILHACMWVGVVVTWISADSKEREKKQNEQNDVNLCRTANNEHSANPISEKPHEDMKSYCALSK